MVLPKVLIEGSTEVVCINLYDMKGPVDIKLQLTNGDAEADVVGYIVEFPYSCLDFVVCTQSFYKSAIVKGRGHQ